MNKLLAGVKVIELGTHVAVPKAARMMADWGAEVIKIEPPKGESWRTMGRGWQMPYSEDNNPIFQTENANKKSIALNLKSEEGKKILMQLLEDADIFLTNTRASALKKLGADYETLSQKFPKLIYAHFSGYGTKGPEKDRPGFDTAAFWSRSGVILEWTTQESQPPFKPHSGFGDSTTGSILLAGILAALYKKTQTGEGEKLDVSLLGSAIWYNSTGIVMGQPQYPHKYPKSIYGGTNPVANLYQSKDGDWIFTSLVNYENQYAEFLKVIGLSQYVGDPRFSTYKGVWANMKFVVDEIKKGFANTPTQVILDGFTALDMVHEKVASSNDLYKDEQAIANDYLREVKLECGDKVMLPIDPVKFSSMEPTQFHLAPHLGADTVDILAGLGYSEEEIKALIEKEAVKAKQ